MMLWKFSRKVCCRQSVTVVLFVIYSSLVMMRYSLVKTNVFQWAIHKINVIQERMFWFNGLTLRDSSDLSNLGLTESNVLML